MKTILFLLCIASVSIAQTVQKVRNESTDEQLKSMVITQWDADKFTPGWYYWLFHNGYRNGDDRRIIFQLSPTFVATYANFSYSRKSKQDTYTITGNRGLKMASSLVKSHYELFYRKKYDAYFDEISTMANEAYIQKKIGYSTLIEFLELRNTIQNRELVVNSGIVNPGDRLDAYREIEKDWQKLKGEIREYLKLVDIKFKMRGE